ncbi:putative Fe-S protein [Mycolicibacterium phlei]|uniref:Sulfurase n=2 Tax=Mycolicibacterium phlei TaxID=1771 RepID=A0A5N5UVC1_MYCPH|nr:MOSC N-terminal beta barrel domain-containing protein [Mycolicibacterium phlei]VEG07547.1 putative Fe-S protein [Mycobacteroides chelonae]AMO59417.1 MOSC domain protein [Mycolicibacterium phlei]EID13641.1 putative Fe-S protein [Mycolicibacterium phlei RIVM601174]KAB7753574.1 sulfurase [Mycolicibacterium phlei DSM 43239 = CCUG 21000]KXW62477.1 sulfurase [Mycolicibacterium phlei DSM 43239 = CCUG 21000]
MAIGQVAELWRYPVKSLGGELVDHLDIGPRGVHGDRLWAVRDLESDVTATARRLPVLLTATARYVGPLTADAGPGNAPEVEIAFPDGAVLSSRDGQIHAKLSELADRDVRLTALPPADDTSLHRLSRNERENASISALRKDFGVGEDEPFPDLSVFRMVDLATLARYSTPPGTFVDLAPVHVITRTSLATIGAELGDDALDVRRFRPNVLLSTTDDADGLPESHWGEAELTVGGAVLHVTMPTIRCVVPSRAQPGLEVDRRITKAVANRAGRCLGVYCWVAAAGGVDVGDDVALRSAAAPRRALADAARRARRFTLGLATSVADRFAR